jgi:hypothetical protein
MDLVHIFYILRRLRVKVGESDVHERLFSDSEFRENWRSKSCTLRGKVN